MRGRTRRSRLNKSTLQQALKKKIKLKQGDKERVVTMATAGIEQLVAQYAKGDRHARRDLIALADKLGVDLMAGHTKAIENALAPSNQEILLGYLDRQFDTVRQRPPVLAPPELLDDEPEAQNRS